MGRTGILVEIAVIGYFLGVAGYYIFKNLEPWLMQVLPNLLQAEWLISGFVGAIFSVILVVIWSYSSKGQ